MIAGESQQEWLAKQYESLTLDLEILSPSEWAEAKRYLPAYLTPMPGPFSFTICPYMREIVDCFDVESQIREVSFMKGVQICATTAVLENIVGYSIDHVRTASVMFVTADAELAKIRLESNITTMLRESGLLDLIKSGDYDNKRKTGRTDKKIEWSGGGFLVPIGAQNANKMRSIPVQFLLNDEIDGWPLVVGRDGDPVKLVRDRTAAFESSRKILDVSTPTVKGTSQIEKLFKRGDQRYYFVRCLRCEFEQVLRFSRTDNDTGAVSGIVWETEQGRLVQDSVRYLCQNCGHAHSDADKVTLFSPDNGAEWKPTAEAFSPDIRSYHLGALYSPPGMQSWAACVQKWLEAWDAERNEARDYEKLQVFYNNVLGETYEIRGEFLRFEQVSPHRRAAYKLGEVPNDFAETYCGSKIMLLTCSVDVHKDCLKVSIFGWCRDARAILIDYQTFEGDVQQLGDPKTWGRVRDIVEGTVEYTSDDGRKYRVYVTVIDSGYLTDHVYRFCDEYASNVFPIKGQTRAHTATRVPEFSPFKTPNGTQCYGITVDLYKDRWAAALRRQWDGQGVQPYRHFNAPADITDQQLRELTGEVKVAKREKGTDKLLGFEWHRRGANELWDLLVYSTAALDLTAYMFCQAAELKQTEWAWFWDYVSENGEGSLWHRDGAAK